MTDEKCFAAVDISNLIIAHIALLKAAFEFTCQICNLTFNLMEHHAEHDNPLSYLDIQMHMVKCTWSNAHGQMDVPKLSENRNVWIS